jgi:hypothetical protein
VPIEENVEAALRSGLAAQSVPQDLIDALISSVSQMIDNFVRGHLRPSELNGGDFAEAVVRILQFLASGVSTPLGNSLPRMDQSLQQFLGSSLDDSLRVHLPRLVQATYDIRNRRGVGHLPGPISANQSDAELLLAITKWILAEFLRLFHASSHQEAQAVIDTMVRRHVPVVEDFEGTLRIVTRANPSLPNRLLALLLAAEHSQPKIEVLSQWARAPRKQVTTALRRLDGRNLIHRYVDGRIALTSVGREEAERLVSALALRPA